MVFPNPTSSARIAPFENGLRKANNAASIWWGFKSTWASANTDASFSTLSEEWRRAFVGKVTDVVWCKLHQLCIKSNFYSITVCFTGARVGVESACEQRKLNCPKIRKILSVQCTSSWWNPSYVTERRSPFLWRCVRTFLLIEAK